MSTSSHQHLPAARVHARPRPGSRRLGYVVAVAVNVGLLYLLNRNPGWEAVPFLTPAMGRVIGVVNLSIAVGAAANLLYVVWDPEWLKALGDLTTTCVGLLAMLRLWQVWPFDFASGTPWDLLARVALGLGLLGSVVGILASTVRYVRALGQPSGSARP